MIKHRRNFKRKKKRKERKEKVKSDVIISSIVAIDGLAGSGKGVLAKALGFAALHFDH